MRNNLFSPSQPINHSVSERVSLSPQHDWKNYSVIKEREALP